MQGLLSLVVKVKGHLQDLFFKMSCRARCLTFVGITVQLQIGFSNKMTVMRLIIFLPLFVAGELDVVNKKSRKLQQIDKLDQQYAQNPCDDIAPKGFSDCSFYMENNFCEALDDVYCRQSCRSCCFDVPIPGISCGYILDSGRCFDEMIVAQGYCQRTCGQCSGDNSTSVDALALLSLRNDARIIGDEFSTWVGEDVCNDWAGVFCKDGRVVELRLTGQVEESLSVSYEFFFGYSFYQYEEYEDLETSIPPEFSLMQELEVLILDGVELTGTIPPELSTLSKLKSLDLRGNALTGTLLPELSALQDLRYLNVAANKLIGQIPESYSALQKLSNLLVLENGLTGTLSPSFSNWENMTIFDIDDNGFNGTLPASFSTWENIVRFYIDRNFLSGTLPPEYSTWNMDGGLFTADSNNFDGQLPIEYSSIATNASFYLFNNMGDLCIEEDVLSFFQQLDGVGYFFTDSNELPAC
eukprot:TRINITY_DN1929_c0_g1_i2.p1 TRINITY_DN1929_c0_g1~~TRINITY_DN1929_c0_g1_i2.p1  ORF type:complete len:469 (-),score=43.58 TRINITY_DN1929_c0_g1_i2:216-1622(-)